MTENPLGSTVDYPCQYAPDILFPIPRDKSRINDPTSVERPVFGIDHWHAYELSWLNPKGLPQVAMAEFFFDLGTPNIVESKSLKLYLNSLNHTVFPDKAAVHNALQQDLADCCGSAVTVALTGLETRFMVPGEEGFNSLNELDIQIEDYSSRTIDSAREAMVEDGSSATRVVRGAFYCDLFRSNCPVTGQPDWATVLISYSGREVPEETLLRYLCSYRNHQAYHEQCADQIFKDLVQACQPDQLELSMHFLRRGGLDINCHRSIHPLKHESIRRRLHRQ